MYQNQTKKSLITDQTNLPKQNKEISQNSANKSTKSRENPSNALNKIQMAKQQPEAVAEQFSLLPKVINGAFFMPIPHAHTHSHASCLIPHASSRTSCIIMPHASCPRWSMGGLRASLASPSSSPSTWWRCASKTKRQGCTLAFDWSRALVAGFSLAELW